MDNNLNICPECGTANEAEYLYCKNCGTKLSEKAKKESHAASQEEYTSQSNYSSYVNSDFVCIDGIPVEELKIYIGKKSNEIMPKIINMDITHSKVSWLWPPAILGFFFGPLGAALWFFYRKMYKHAFILSGIGFIINLIISILTFDTTNASIDIFINAFSSGNFTDAISEIINNTNSLLNSVANSVENISTVVISVIVGIFGCGWYKNHCIYKIKSFREMNPDNNYYKLGLMSLGGTSGGMLALGILLAFASSYVITLITTIFATIL